MLNLSSISTRYDVKPLTDQAVPEVCALCRDNPLYYRFCPPFVTEDSIRSDMAALPPGTKPEDKHYLGFYDGTRLIAVMDLIDHFPSPELAFIGFFMTKRSLQRRGVGSRIIRELCDSLREQNYTAVRLCWITENPQSRGFWLKNQFVETGKGQSASGHAVTLAQRSL